MPEIEILKLALEAVVQTGVGKFTEAGLAKGKQLWEKIRQRLQKEETAIAALEEAKQQQSETILEQQVAPFLQVEMLRDRAFAQEVQTLATEVKQSIAHSEDQIQMNANAYDQSTVKQVGKIDADTVNF